MQEEESAIGHAAALLSAAWQTSVRLEQRERFESAHLVLRCDVHGAGGAAGLPASVIIKRRSLDGTPAGSAPGLDQTLLFLNEWATLDFLTSLGGAPLGPRLYASDRAAGAGMVVLEDLGAAPSVQQLHYDDERDRAAEALVATGRLLGQIQVAAYGREENFRAHQQRLGAATVACDASLDLRALLGDLRMCGEALGLQLGAPFERAIAELEEAIHGPGPFRSLVHNDAGLHNFLAAPGGVRLLDFEFAGYGHGLIDVVCARLAFPPAFRGRIIPPELVRRLEGAYRGEVAAHIRAAADDARFSEALAQACAHWAYSKLWGFWRFYLRERLAEGEAYDSRGSTPERRAFFRRQVFTYLRLALATLEEERRLPALREALARIVERLLAHWPETPLLDTYPAHGGPPWRYP